MMSCHTLSKSFSLKTLSELSSRQQYSPRIATPTGPAIPGGKPRSNALQPGIPVTAPPLPLPLPPLPLFSGAHDSIRHQHIQPRPNVQDRYHFAADSDTTTSESAYASGYSATNDGENDVDDPGGSDDYYYHAVAAHQANLDHTRHGSALVFKRRYAAYESLEGSIWFSTRIEDHIFATSPLFKRLPDYVLALDMNSQHHSKARREPVSPLLQSPVAEQLQLQQPLRQQRQQRHSSQSLSPWQQGTPIPVRAPTSGLHEKSGWRDPGFRHKRSESEGVPRNRRVVTEGAGRVGVDAGSVPDGVPPMFGSIRLRESMRRKKVPERTVELD